MKKLILLALVLFSAATMLAQTNRMSYQAVVRNAANELVAEENLTVAIRISDANSTSVFSETHSVTSNRNGVISLMIGEGSGQSGNMASVDWRTAQIHTEVTLPGGATLSNTTPVNAVPYAFYADSVDIHWVNDAVDDYLEHHSISTIVETDPTVPAWAKEATKPVYDYSEITNTPDMSGYLTSETDPTVPDWAKESVKPVYDYSEITNTPDMTPYLTIESDPTVNNSTITIQQNGDLVGSFTLNQASDQTINITVPTSGGGGSVPQTLNISGNVITLSDGGGSVTLPAETDPTVPAWAKESVKPVYDYSEITNTPDMTPYLTTESDPTVPAWAKESVKPVYDYSEITNTPDMTPYLTTESDPTVNDGTLTITLPDGTSSTFTANQGGNTNVAIPAMSVADLLALVGGMTDAEKAALRDALGVTGGGSSDPTTFVCGTSKMVDADGNEYETVQIGMQCWTKANLRTTTSAVASAAITDATSSGAYSYTEPYYYDYSSHSLPLATRGYLYNWPAANLVCPAGWHLPSDAEWNTLEETVSGTDWQANYAIATGYRGSHAGKLAGEGWNSSWTAGASGDASDLDHNASGFGAVPAGGWSSGFDGAGSYAYFWSSTEYGTNSAWHRYLNYNFAHVSRFNDRSRDNGFSVRCLRDETGGGTALTEPTVTTSGATDVTETSATLNGSVSTPDGVTITAQGFEWKATTSGAYVAVNATGETMTYNLTGLTAGTSYTYRAFVTTAAGTSYGDEVAFTTTASGSASFTCGTSKMVDADGNEYETVLIGTQCWTKTNLRSTKAADGSAIPAGGSTISYTAPYYYDYSSHSLPLATRGYLYNWPAANEVCPAGWHLPSDAEWNTMEATVSGSDWQTSYETSTGNRGNHAGKLAGGDNWTSSTTSGAPGDYDNADRNVSGFSAVPAGYCSGSSFGNAGYNAYFWSSTQYDSKYAYGRGLYYGYVRVLRDDDYKGYGFSVRCLRDETGGGTASTEPTVTTSGATDVTETSATLNGSVSNPDGVTITAQGFEWKATTSGTYAQVTATGFTMTYSLTGLTAGTSYTYRAFVTTAAGTSYGEAVSFTTLAAGGGAVEGDAIPCPNTPTVTDHEGNVYATVQIGNQCWMRDNLRTTTSPSTGTYLIPAASTGYTYTGKQARWYNNDSATYAPMNYGLLYNWNAAVDTFNTAYGETSVNTSTSNAVSVSFSGHRRGICPAGWHLPSDAEWTALTDYVSSQSEYTCGGNSNYIAKALASTEGWNSYSGECYPGDQIVTANNATGFSAVPAGACYGSSFDGAGANAYFWGATQHASGPGNAYNRYLDYYYAYVNRSGNGKDDGFSVRCLRD